VRTCALMRGGIEDGDKKRDQSSVFTSGAGRLRLGLTDTVGLRLFLFYHEMEMEPGCGEIQASLPPFRGSLARGWG
jgi:hypothetical protein